MPEYEMFVKEMRRLCRAFGKPMDAELIHLYFRSLGTMTDDNVRQLVQWAIDNVASGFPTIATLRNYALSQRWSPSGTSDVQRGPLEIIICPECGGSFAVARRQLELDAQAGRSYLCINHEHWRCPGQIFARTILERVLS
jgi:hypothetical protein